jgi:PucR C-terminal helix-turn-helix domain/GGDEF-like domain/GAF domain
MTTHSSSLVAESASNTIDPDSRARRTNDGELSAGFQSDLTIDDDAGGELLYADELPAEDLAGFVDNTELYTEYRRLAAEQAAMRRVAALVAGGAEPSELFDAVTNELRSCVNAATAGLWRYESTGEITLVSVAAYLPDAAMKWPVGTRTPIEGNTLAEEVQRTGRPARVDTYENVTGAIAKLARAIGLRAAAGVPVVVDGRLWGMAAVGSDRPGPMPADTEVRMSHCAELIATALVAGYRDEQKRQMLGASSQRPVLIDSLLEGRLLDPWSLWEVASNLGLPSNGPFVVIAAEVPAAGTEALPDIESKLRSLDVHSAWRLLPELQVGIVHVASEQHLDKVVALMSRMEAGRVGVSAPFVDLRDTPQALHFAKVMLRGPTDATSSVAVFDGSILATAAVSAPEAMIKTVGAALNGFGDLPDEDREILFDTFRVWQENNASVTDAAEALFCHPNTVRHRLRRLEKRTGRSLSRPRDVAELCLAFEVHRRLM